MYLVMVFLRTDIIAEGKTEYRKQVSKSQLPEIPREADDKGHDQKVRKEEEVFPCLQPFHIVHYRQVKVEVQYRHDPRKLVVTAQVQMIGDDKDVGSTEIDKRTDIKPETEIGDDTNKVCYKDEKDELVEPDRLLPFRRRIITPEPGIDYILIKGSKN